MASIEELKNRIDLEDLAERLGLERPGKTGNWKSPHHADKSPSLEIAPARNPKSWRDYSSDDGGSCIDLVMYVRGIDDVGEAIKELHNMYAIPLDKPQRAENEPRREASRRWRIVSAKPTVPARLSSCNASARLNSSRT